MKRLDMIDQLENRYQIVRLLRSGSELLEDKLESYRNQVKSYHQYYSILKDIGGHGKVAELFTLQSLEIPIEVRSEVTQLNNRDAMNPGELKLKLLKIEQETILQKAASLHKRKRTCC